MKSSPYWHRIIRYPVADDVDLELCLRKRRGTLERFSLIFRYKINGRWRMIKRCDNSELHGGIPHCHFYKIGGSETKENVGDAKDNMGIIAAILVEDLKQNYEKVVANYKYSK